MKAQSILCVGGINMDLVMETERLPERGETFFGRNYGHVPGGKGANQAVAAARLGAEVSLLGMVGEDKNGRSMLENFQNEGVLTDFIGIDHSEPSGLAAIVVEDCGDNRIILFNGANENLGTADIEKAFTKTYDAVLMNLEAPESAVPKICKKCRENSIPLVLDAGPPRGIDYSKLDGIDIISPNETETAAITGIKITSTADAESAARKLIDICGARIAVIKWGEHGSLIYQEGRSELVPPFSVKAVDSTAAGDTFSAALTVKYYTTGDLREAVRYANAAGALSCTKLGAQTSLPTVSELDYFLENYIVSG